MCITWVYLSCSSIYSDNPALRPLKHSHVRATPRSHCTAKSFQKTTPNTVFYLMSISPKDWCLMSWKSAKGLFEKKNLECIWRSCLHIFEVTMYLKKTTPMVFVYQDLLGIPKTVVSSLFVYKYGQTLREDQIHLSSVNHFEYTISHTFYALQIYKKNHYVALGFDFFSVPET